MRDYFKICYNNKFAAVKNNGNVVQYIDNPSEEVHLEAVRQSRLAILYIKYPSKTVGNVIVKITIDYLLKL